MNLTAEGCQIHTRTSFGLMRACRNKKQPRRKQRCVIPLEILIRLPGTLWTELGWTGFFLYFLDFAVKWMGGRKSALDEGDCWVVCICVAINLASKLIKEFCIPSFSPSSSCYWGRELNVGPLQSSTAAHPTERKVISLLCFHPL